MCENFTIQSQSHISTAPRNTAGFSGPKVIWDGLTKSKRPDQSPFLIVFGNYGHRVVQAKEETDCLDCYQHTVQNTASPMVWGGGRVSVRATLWMCSNSMSTRLACLTAVKICLPIKICGSLWTITYDKKDPRLQQKLFVKQEGERIPQIYLLICYYLGHFCYCNLSVIYLYFDLGTWAWHHDLICVLKHYIKLTIRTAHKYKSWQTASWLCVNFCVVVYCNKKTHTTILWSTGTFILWILFFCPCDIL